MNIFWGTSFQLGGGGLVAEQYPILATLWTIALQAPVSMGFPWQKHWHGLPFPSPGDLPTQGSNQHLLHCKQVFTTGPPGKPHFSAVKQIVCYLYFSGLSSNSEKLE